MEYDVVALGELLIDFTNSGISQQGNPVYEANPGGAPCNALAMLARRGKKTAFIGKVGEDIFGKQLKGAIEKEGIDARGLLMDKDVNTTLAIVQNAADGDREFSFFRKPGADTCLRPEELPVDLLENCRIFHFGSLSLTHEPARGATRRAVEIAEQANRVISFDPNYRPPLWEDREEARRQIAWGCAQCHILKIADDELAFLTGCEEIAEGAEKLRQNSRRLRLIFVTKGSKGAACFYEGVHVERPAYLGLKTVDTTGAGDVFFGSCLADLLDYDVNELEGDTLGRILEYANAAAALVTTKKGALRAVPQLDDIRKLMARE